MMLKSQLLKLASVVSIAGMLLTSAAPVVQARELMKDFNFTEFEQSPREVTKDFVASKSPKTSTFSRKESINDVTKVGVVGFQVVFAETTAEQIDGSTWKGITQGNFSDNRWELAVVNMTPQLRQQITETLYEDFKAQLEEVGFEVVSQDTLAASQHYQDFIRETTTDKNVMNQTQRMTNFGKNTVWSVVPQGMPIEIIDLSSDIFVGAKPSFVGSFRQTGNAFAQGRKTGSLSEAYKDFSGFTPVSVTYFVDFKKQKAIGGFLPTNPFGSSDKDSMFGLSVSPGSYVRFYTEVGKDDNHWKQKYAAAEQLNFLLKKPVQSVEPVGYVKFDKENIGAQVMGVAANMAFRQMGMGGVMKTRRVRKYELVVERDAYGKQANKVLEAVNRMMMTAITGEATAAATAGRTETAPAITTTVDTPADASAETETVSEATEPESAEAVNVEASVESLSEEAPADTEE